MQEIHQSWTDNYRTCVDRYQTTMTNARTFMTRTQINGAFIRYESARCMWPLSILSQSDSVQFVVRTFNSISDIGRLSAFSLPMSQCRKDDERTKQQCDRCPLESNTSNRRKIKWVNIHWTWYFASATNAYLAHSTHVSQHDDEDDHGASHTMAEGVKIACWAATALKTSWWNNNNIFPSSIMSKQH